MAQPVVQARPRSVLGKKVKTLRRKGILPANVYGHNRPSQALELDAHAFSLLQRRLPPNAVVDLVIEGEGSKARPAMIHRTQLEARTGRPIHIEFFQIDPRERLTASVPVVLVGEPEIVRRGDAVLLHEMHMLEVICLLSDLPHAIEVPASALQYIGDAVRVQDLPIDLTRIEVKAHADDVVMSLRAPQMQREEEETAPVQEPALVGEEESES